MTDADDARLVEAPPHLPQSMEGGMAKVETTLTLEQLDAALELNGKLRAFDAGYAKGFAAGLEAGAEIVEIICERFGNDCKEPKLFRMLSVGLTAAIRAHAREEKATP